jgi:hypothetical protein
METTEPTTLFLPVTNQTAPFTLSLNGATAGSPLHPWINQPILSTNLWNVDASINKTSPSGKRQAARTSRFLNVFNTPGNAFAAASDGTVPTWTNQNGARVDAAIGALELVVSRVVSRLLYRRYSLRTSG